MADAVSGPIPTTPATQCPPVLFAKTSDFGSGIADTISGADPAKAAALSDLCLALLNRNAFVPVE